MVVEPSPAAPLGVPQAKVLLEVLVVALDTPTLVGAADQIVQGSALGQRLQDVFDWLGLLHWPLDEQPLLRAQTRLASIATSVTHPHRCEPSREWRVGALAPTDCLERLRR